MRWCCKLNYWWRWSPALCARGTCQGSGSPKFHTWLLLRTGNVHLNALCAEIMMLRCVEVPGETCSFPHYERLLPNMMFMTQSQQASGVMHTWLRSSNLMTLAQLPTVNYLKISKFDLRHARIIICIWGCWLRPSEYKNMSPEQPCPTCFEIQGQETIWWADTYLS